MLTLRSTTELEVLRAQVTPAYADEGLDVDLREEIWAITASIDGGVPTFLLLQVNALDLNVLSGPAWDLLKRSANGRPIVIKDRTARRLTVLPDRGLPSEAVRTPLPDSPDIVWDDVGGGWKSVDV